MLETILNIIAVMTAVSGAIAVNYLVLDLIRHRESIDNKTIRVLSNLAIFLTAMLDLGAIATTLNLLGVIN